MGDDTRQHGATLAREQPFGSSLLWELQTSAYEDLGANAWGQGPVPLYITSNPYLARQYAQVAYAFLRDWDRQYGLDLDEPVYLLDIGAGCGRLAYLFQQELHLLLKEHPRFYNLKLKTLLLELVSGTVAYWKLHPYLKALAEDGLVDFVHYDAIAGGPLHLEHSGLTIEPGSLTNPVLSTANYLFDTIPQDLFRIRDGCIQQGCINLWVDREEVTDLKDASLIDELQWSYSYKDISEIPFPKKSIEYRVLEHYRREFREASCCLPDRGFKVLDHLKSLSPRGFLILSGDQGVSRKDEIASWGAPKLSLHGTFSVPVDYYALGLYFELSGAQVWRSKDHDQDFVLLAGCVGLESTLHSETGLAFEQVVNGFEPQNYWTLMNCIEEECPKPSLDQLLRLLKLGNWDPPILHAFYAEMREQAGHASEKDKDKLCRAMERVAERFFPLSPAEGQFFTNLGIVAFEIQRFEVAQGLFQRTLDLVEDFSPAWFYKGMCYKFLGRMEESVACLKRAKQLDPKLG